jgi:hypothetical protein
MKALFTALGVVLLTCITVLVLVVEPASAATYHPIWSARPRQIESTKFVTRFTKGELYEAFYRGHIQANFPTVEAARRSEELSNRFAGAVQLTLTDTGAMYIYNLDTGLAFLARTGYRMNQCDLIVGDESQEAVGVYNWRLADNVLNLDVVADSDPTRVVMLTLHPWVGLLYL